MSVMSNECLIPYKGYNMGEEANDPFAASYLLNRTAFSKISTDSHCHGGLS